jgi:hypothetical protein
MYGPRNSWIGGHDRKTDKDTSGLSFAVGKCSSGKVRKELRGTAVGIMVSGILKKREDTGYSRRAGSELLTTLLPRVPIFLGVKNYILWFSVKL